MLSENLSDALQQIAGHFIKIYSNYTAFLNFSAFINNALLTHEFYLTCMVIFSNIKNIFGVDQAFSTP